MYRQYEDPYKLENQLKEWLESHPDKSEWDEYDYETYNNLKERINFAWQDDEYECNYMRENYGPEYGCDSSYEEDDEHVFIPLDEINIDTRDFMERNIAIKAENSAFTGRIKRGR